MSHRHSPREGSVLESALDHINHGVVIYDQDLVVVRINRRAREILHVPTDMFSDGEAFEKLVRINAGHGGYGGIGAIEERVAKRMEKARSFAPFKEDQQIFDGSTVEVFGHPIPDGGYAITYTDITRRTEAEAELEKARDELEHRVGVLTNELREREAQLRLVTDNVPALIAYIDRDLVIRFANRPYADFYGVAHDEILGMSVRHVIGIDRFELGLPYANRTLAGEVTSNEGEALLPDHEKRYLRTSRVPHFGDDGEVQGYFIILVDLTEHREREEQLRQAQKIEAVGQLTSGVAHDFNNLLAVTMGNAQILALRLHGQDDLQLLTSSIVKAAERGAELTQRLLAFSRKQTLQPKSMQLGVLCEGMNDLLSRSLGETIEVEMGLDDDTWDVLADPGQVENAVLNLAINASHAMPNGGKLTIGTENTRVTSEEWINRWEGRPGEYVALRVTDNGTGMPAEVLEHVFEPFFTTKDAGQGSGLGLSMVHGFAHQSGGFVKIESAEGKGTMVTIYLPKTRPNRVVPVMV